MRPIRCWPSGASASGEPRPELPAGNAGAGSTAKRHWPAGTLDVRDAAVPYNYGREGDVYHFSYAWIYPAAGS